MSSHVGLTKEESQHLLLLMEGDISDLEVPESDSEDDEDEIATHFERNNAGKKAVVDSENIPEYFDNLRLGVEVEDQRRIFDDNEKEDNLPLSIIAERERLKLLSKAKLNWVKRDIYGS
ncbi:hypothetical protein JTB14_034577 [Gonioctena quinquepunctata]|nr:hypothetical protein JTB14_034577 [Gonioctena quinquepunctata]